MGNILENYLDNLADAIRLKTGGTTDIEAMDFATEIKSIPQNTTGIFQEKDIQLTSASNTIITPDSDYDGLTKINITPKLQEKTTSITTNTTTTITSDTGNIGLSKVTANVTVANKFTYKYVWANGASNKSGTASIPAEVTQAYLVIHMATQNDFNGSSVSGTGLTITRQNDDNLGMPWSSVNGGIRYSMFVYKITKTAGTARTLSINCSGNAIRYSCPVLIYVT